MCMKIPPDHVIKLTKGNPNFTKNISKAQQNFMLRQ